MDDSVTWLTQVQADLPGSQTWLSSGERARLDRMQVPKRRNDFLLGRWTAKRVMAALLGGRAYAEIDVRASGDGSPQAYVDGVASRWSVSLGHSAGRAIAVVRPSGLIGADIERVEPRSQGLVDDFFTPDEVAWVAARAPAERDRSIAVIWSAKESALKALRRGLREDTRHVHVGGVDDRSGATWSPLRVAVTGAPPLSGWWRFDAGFAITIVGSDPVSVRAAAIARP
jgi:4'-phosphopantetheinyl transferase